jgi:aromatic-L-amino-acid decarboxylase
MAEHRAGLDEADSITIDPHKGLYAPFECGALLVRDADALRAAFSADGQYMQDIPRDEVNFFERGPELTRGTRALKLWLLLRAVGTDAIAAEVRKDLRLARLARDLLAEDRRISIVTEPLLSVFTFAVDGGEPAGRRLVERILADGHLMLSSSRVRGEFVLRFCVVNHRTEQHDIESSVARIRQLL